MRKILRKILPYLTFAFICIIGYLLYENLSSIEWDKVGTAIRKISPVTVVLSLGVSALIYFILSNYDYLSFLYLKIKEGVKYTEILSRAFTCYAFNLNFGSLIGGLALRYRVYSKWKVSLDRIPYIIAASTFTNWLGYSFLLAIMISFKAREIEGLIPLSAFWIRSVGIAILFLITSYFWSSFKGKQFHFRGEDWQIPKIKFAAFQLMLSTLQWSLQSVIIYTLLRHLEVEVAYSQILFTFMISSIVAVFTHIPAGLGVLEVIFLRMELGIPHSDLLVALIIYRLVYYLIPLLAALPVYAGLEVKRKQKS
ncbi:MAG: lysylphosphatidylglycerol synthase domain-containing protein [Bacteriovoracia bacterium]